MAEVENATTDGWVEDPRDSLVIDCMAALVTAGAKSDEQPKKQLVAYCILSPDSVSQLGITKEDLQQGAILWGPLLTLLRARCDRFLRKGCTPAFFVAIQRFPLSPTGKRDRSGLPALEKCVFVGNQKDKNLWECGRVGQIVAEKIVECLNL